MAFDPARFSVAELRRRLADPAEPVSAQLLGKLRRDPRRGVRELVGHLERRRRADQERRVHQERLLDFERVLWRSGIRHVAGVDEAGVGPLAGPVVAAAVVFPPHVEIDGIDDSKRLAVEERERLASTIRATATAVALGVAEVEEIDELNVYHAALLAMRRAVEALPLVPEHLLVDAREIPDVAMPQNPFDKGDGINFSIAAASIIAKTHRDAVMDELDARFPGYGFARHKGYATPDHQEAIRRRGPCPIHRSSFTFIRELCGGYSPVFYRLQERLEAAADDGELAAAERAVVAAGCSLSEVERKKLRLTLNRRWKRRK